MNRSVFISFAIISLIGIPVCGFSQSPAISYLIPDIGAAGMNTYVEIIAPYNASGGFGNDELYANNPGDAVRVVCSNPGDTSKITIGPVIVSWNGRVISTQIFVSPCQTPNSSDWRSLDPEFAIPLKVIVNNVTSNADTFFVVKPFPALKVSGGGVLGSGGQWGTRSKRGALIFDSISLGSGTYTISASDCDPTTIGNQGYLPAVILSKGNVTLGSGAILSGSANGKNGGPGGGGGSMGDGPVIDSGGFGFVGGSPGESGGVCPAVGGTGTGGGGDMYGGGIGLNRIIPEPSDVPNCEYYGGTGNPFISSGGGVLDHNKHEGDGNGGGFGTAGENGLGQRGSSPDVGGVVNGNPMLIPLMGGSGGGGGNEFCTCDEDFLNTGASAGGGGGGVCLFAPQINAANGFLQVNGASGVTGGVGCVGHGSVGGCGSGGGATIEAKLGSYFPSISAAGGISLHTHPDAGNGGSGRVRFDGPLSNNPSVLPNVATMYRGLSTDTSHTPGSPFTLEGTGDGDSIRIYIKVGTNSWQIYGTVGGYLQNAWSYQINTDPNQTTYVVAMQQRLNPSTIAATLEPSWVMSQAATNILSKYSSGGSSNFSLSPTTQSVFQDICGAKDTGIKLGGSGCPGVTLDGISISGSSAFRISDGRNTPRTLDSLDSVRIVFTPTPPGLDTSYLHIRYGIGSTLHDTVIRLIGILDPSLRTLTLVVPASPSRIEADCNARDTTIMVGITGCTALSGKLDSVWMAGSPAITLNDPRGTPRSISFADSIAIGYVPSGNAPDTSILHIRYDLGSGVQDTTITIIGNQISPFPARVLKFSSDIDSIISTSSCAESDTGFHIGITGCPLTSGELDSMWIVGSATIRIDDARPMPRSLGLNDSIGLQYAPSNGNSDTAELHIRYDLGSGVQDTVITVIGTVSSPLVSQSAQVHHESASAYYGALDSLTLQLDLSGSINLDSLWNLVTDIQGTCDFDHTVVSAVGYVPPVPWTLTSFTPHTSTFDFEIHNSTGKGKNPFDLGTALFSPRSSELATSWVTVSKLLIRVGTQTYSLCVTDNEDNHWAVKTLGILSGVTLSNTAPEADKLLVYPNPAGDEVFVQNPSEFPASIAVYDVIGREVASASAAGASTSSIAIESLPRGAYVLICHIAGRTETKRITKE